MKVLVAVLFAAVLALAPAAWAGQDDNDANVSQSGKATTGDVVGGISLGGVVTGSVSIDATNSSEDVDIESGDASASNTADVQVGDSDGGDNEAELSQSASASTGDAVGGLVSGFTVTGGDLDAVLANTSIDVDGESGDASQSNTAFVDLAVSK